MSEKGYRPQASNPYLGHDFGPDPAGDLRAPAGTPAATALRTSLTRGRTSHDLDGSLPMIHSPYQDDGSDDNAELDAAAPRGAHRALSPDATVAASAAAFSPDATVAAAPAMATTHLPDAAPTSVGVPFSPDATVAAPQAVFSPDATVAAAPATAAPRPAAATAVAAAPAPAPRPAPPRIDTHRAEMARRLMDADRPLYDDYDAGFGGAAKGGVMGERFIRARHQRAMSKGPLSGRRLRFWRWFRAIPITLMLLVGIASWALSAVPGTERLARLLYPVSYTSAIEQAAATYGVDPTLVAAVIKSESGWNPSAVSSVGAQGLMQVMPSTARELANQGLVDASVYDPNDLGDPEVNIAYGTAYLARLIDSTGSVDEAVAAYNAGPGATQSWREADGAEDAESFHDLIQYPETRSYLDNVLSAYEHYQELYPDGLSAS